MQLGPAIRRLLVARQSLSQAPRRFDSGSLPSPMPAAYTVADFSPAASASRSTSATAVAGTMSSACPSATLFRSFTVNAGNGDFLHCIQIDTTASAGKQVFSVFAYIAFYDLPKF